MSVCLAEKVSKVLDRFEPNSVPKDSLGPGEDTRHLLWKIAKFPRNSDERILRGWNHGLVLT